MVPFPPLPLPLTPLPFSYNASFPFIIIINNRSGYQKQTRTAVSSYTQEACLTPSMALGISWLYSAASLANTASPPTHLNPHSWGKLAESTTVENLKCPTAYNNTIKMSTSDQQKLKDATSTPPCSCHSLLPPSATLSLECLKLFKPSKIFSSLCSLAGFSIAYLK